MWTRKLLLASLVLLSLGVKAPVAQAAVDLFVNVEPPPLRYEALPEPRRGYVWVPGYWDWRNQHHVWVRGTWQRERVGYYYHPHRWVERDGGWTMQRGRWDRSPYGDRDHDGVPNYRDRAPDDPHRY